MINLLLNIDTSLFLFINRLPHPNLLNLFFRIITGVGEWGLVWFAIALIIIYKERHHSKIILELVIGLVTASYFSQSVLKDLFLRLRPEFLLKGIKIYTETNDYLSFPSSHAATAFAGAYILSREIPKMRWYFYFLAFLIAFSRVYLGVHYPLDIIFGSLLGILVGYLVLKFMNSKRLGKILLIIVFCGLFFPENTFAKTVLTLDQGQLSVFHEQQVLGVSTDSDVPQTNNVFTPLEFINKFLKIDAILGKLKIADQDLGMQEIDEIIVKLDGQNEIRVKAENSRVVLQNKVSQAITDLPVYLKQRTGEFIVKTSVGEKIVNFLPNIPLKFELKENQAKLVYEITKTEEKKLFGIIPLKTDITTTVSAQTGKVENKISPWINQFLQNLAV